MMTVCDGMAYQKLMWVGERSWSSTHSCNGKCNYLFYYIVEECVSIESIHRSIVQFFSCVPVFPNYFKYFPNSPGFGRDLLRLKPVGVRWFGNLSIPSVFSIHRRVRRRRRKKYIETPSCLLYPPRIIQILPIPSSPPLLSHCNCTVHSTGTYLSLLPLVPKSSIPIYYRRV